MKQVVRLHLAGGDTIDLLPSFAGREIGKTVADDVQQNIAAQQVFRILSGKLNDFVVKNIEMVPLL